MWLILEHVTRFAYDAPISEAYTEIRLKPAHDEGQRCSSFALTTEPRNLQVDEYRDRFGNTVHHFDVLEPHDRVAVTVRSEVFTSAASTGSHALSEVDRWDFLRRTHYVPLDGAIGELAASSASDAPPTLDAAKHLMHVVRESMTYERGSTNVHTRADEALVEGRGVCQDFAHVLLGVCRTRGIPARYVSGYLFDPEHDEEHGASHAWVDVYDDERGWTSLDPTHDTEQTERYVRLAVGRDYADVPPTRGVYKGHATEALEVSVRIREP
jgi:transglutaminase-like putative cysteine protease